MVYNNIDKLIAEAMKNKDNVRLSTLRLIKAKFLEYKTSKGAKPIDEAVEINILRKMVSERNDSIAMYIAGNRNDLADKEINEIAVIKEFLPEDISEEQIADAFTDIVSNGIEPIKRNMGLFIKEIKSRYPTADGKTISSFVSKRLT